MSSDVYTLEITLLSPLVSSGGGSDSATIDRDVVFDRNGRPLIPARRLKGLWRESLRDLEDALGIEDESKSSPAAALFGSRDAAAGDGGLLAIGDARHGEEDLSGWLDWLIGSRFVSPNEVVESFCERRAQTAISRSTGAPEQDTLRLTRLLRSGLVFRAPVRFRRAPGAEAMRAAALAAAGVKRMGLSRTRGAGEVRCRLLRASEGRDEPPDMTREALSERSLEVRVPTGRAGAPAASGAITAEPPVAAPSHVLRYRLRLEAKAVFSTAEGDPNRVATENRVPGSAVLGALAWRWLAGRAADARFRHLFVEGAVRFLDALPEDPTAVGGPRRLVPVPVSVRRLKEEPDRALDLADVAIDSDSESPAMSLSRLGALYGRRVGFDLDTCEVATTLDLHHANADDRGYGRAFDSERPGGGAVFSYESIEPGQAFIGALLGQEPDLVELRHSNDDGTTLMLGRSCSAEYGGRALLEWIGDPLPLDEVGSEWEGWGHGTSEPPSAPSASGGKVLRITCISPLVAVNERGHPVPELPLAELARVLETDAEKIKVVRSWVRTGVAGGVRGHLRVRRAQVPCVASGSVFEVLVDEVCVKNAGRLERDGLGLRKAEGFGRVAVNRHGWTGPAAHGAEEEDFANEAEVEAAPRSLRIKRLDSAPRRPDVEPPKAVLDLVVRIAARRAIRAATRAAVLAAEAARGTPTASQLARVSRTLAQNGCGDAARHLDDLDGNALGKCMLRLPAEMARLTGGEAASLLDTVRRVLERPDEFAQTLFAAEIARARHGASLAGSGVPLDQLLVSAIARAGGAEAVAIRFCSTFVAALARRLRAQKQRTEEPTAEEPGQVTSDVR